MSNKFSRRSFGKLAAGAVLAGEGWHNELFASWAPVAGDDSDRLIFPFGAKVFRNPNPPIAELPRDFRILRHLGFTMIKIQEVWAYDERREGEIDLSTVERIVADARQSGLRVLFTVTMECAPAWLWQKYPDASFVYETGEAHNDPTQSVQPADGKPGPCWHHPGVRESAIRFIEHVGREIGKYDNIQAWNVWQEIGFWPMRPGHLGLCYCHNTLPEFRKWLRSRYESLENLNAAWRSPYGDWEEVEPPRFGTAVPAIIDWRYFMDDVYLAMVVKLKSEAFRRSDPLGRPTLAHISMSPDFGSSSPWRYAEGVDVFGISCYPPWTGFDPWDFDAPVPGKAVPRFNGLYHELWENVMMKSDYIRSSKRDRNTWTAELQGGPITEGLDRRRVPDAADIRRWALANLACGMRGICFWNQRPDIYWQDGYGFSLLDWGSDTTPRAVEACRISRAVNAHAQLFAQGVHPEPGVALVINEDLWHFAQNSVSNVREHLTYTIRGIWKSLWDQGVPVGFIDAGDIPSDASVVKVLILPFPVALGGRVIKALTSYVRSGGTVISEACPGRFDEFGMGYEGGMSPGVPELFGSKHRQVVLIGEPNGGAKWTGTPRSYGDFVEYRDLVGSGDFKRFLISPAYYLQTLEPTTATPIFLWGDEVAACENRMGQGRALLVGTLLGHNSAAYNDRRNGAFLVAILKQAGVLPDRVGNLVRRRRVLGDHQAWFFFNITQHPVGEEIPVAGFKSVKDLLGGDLRMSQDRVQLKVESLDIRCLLLTS